MAGDTPDWRDDLRTAFGFFTRLPVAAHNDSQPQEIARALRLSPLVGAFIGALSGSLYWIGLVIGLSPFLSAILSVLTAILVTGALHEQAFSRTVDGFAHDSGDFGRMGMLGVLALLFSVLLRSGAVAELSEPGSVFVALVAAGALSRTVMYAVMTMSRDKQARGFNMIAAKPEAEDALIAGAITVLITLIALPVSTAVPVMLAAALSGWVMLIISNRLKLPDVSSHNVLGAAQQVAEISMLLVLTALLTI